MIIDPNLAMQAVIKVAEVILAIREDIPQAERVKHHERWGVVADGLWKFIEKGLQK